VRCSVINSTAIACRTPEVVLHDLAYQQFIALHNTVQLRVYLGDGSDVLNNRDTKFKLDFRLFENPEVQEWESVRGFPVHSDATIIRITVS